MNSVDLVDTSWLQPFTRCLENRGIDTARYLEQQYIAPEMVAEGNGKILKRQAWRFMETVERREGLDTLGFLDNDPVSTANLGGLSTALTQAVTLKDAIDTFCRLIATSVEGNTAWLQQGPAESWLLCHTENLQRNARVSDHYTIVVLRQVLRLAAGGDWQPSKICFYSTPSSAIRRIPGLQKAEICFEQNAAGIAFPSSLLARPVPPTEHTSLLELTDPGTAQNARLSEALTLSLRCLVSGHNLPSACEIAEIAGISRVTLYRLLAAEGTSFRKMIERARFEKSRELIADPGLSIKAIAYELGYENPGNFVRAFRRMAGCTPLTYRHCMTNRSAD